jgi:hypothetical protein
MYGGFGRGRSAGSGARGGQGFGFRGSSPPWPYVGRGRGGLPRCAYYTGVPAPTGPASATATMPREEELTYLKNQAQAIKDDLERINFRVHNLESGK